MGNRNSENVFGRLACEGGEGSGLILEGSNGGSRGDRRSSGGNWIRI